MRQLKRILIAVLIGAMVVVGAWAQKGNSNTNRPPKERPPVVDKDKQKPPPSNSNKGRPE